MVSDFDNYRVGANAAVYVCSIGLARMRYLPRLLGVESTCWLPTFVKPASGAVVVGWGAKPSGRRARKICEQSDARPLLLEDGFLRSVGLGVNGSAALSVVVDDVGIYYDTTRPSRLSEMLNEVVDGADPLNDPALLARAQHCMRRIGEARLSKYNHAPDPVRSTRRKARSRQVLVVDQTWGDASVRYGQADEADFRAMYEAALAENPEAEIWVKMHPDVIAGQKRGYLLDPIGDPRVTVVSENVNPRALVEQVERVYTVTSQLGLEAVFAGVSVSVFGVPFYAGWGLTDDRRSTPHACRRRSVEQLFAAAYILYPRYLDPATGERCDVETVIEHLALQRYWHQQNRGSIFCVGFQFWKRRFVHTFLWAPGNRVQFINNAAQARRRGFSSDSRLVVWGQREPPAIRSLAQEFRIPIERVEDGFLRSSGLGSDFTLPLSLVADRSGMYYDPHQPSDLDQLLAEADIDDGLCTRARALRHRIIELAVSKYNFGVQRRLEITPGPDQTVVLVPGQVEDDVSIRLGCPGARSNQALLEAVRTARPEAYIVYKPHPEILSGNRKGAGRLAPGERLWDAVATDVSVTACLAAADEVHTLTSLVGFEALLRELPVVVYGQPFYAGWGLTQDLHPLDRRMAQRRLTLDELVAAALIVYPRYVDPRTGWFTTPEVVVDLLERQANRDTQSRQIQQRWAVRQLRKLWRLANLSYARSR